MACAAWLLEQGVEGAVANDSGNTPLRKSRRASMHDAAHHHHHHYLATHSLHPNPPPFFSLPQHTTKKDWAVQNQHPEVVKLLLEKLGERADVLCRNAFGKSVLTEGFSGQDQGILRLLLEHSSADEERLLMGKKEKGEKEGEEGMEVVEKEGEGGGGNNEEGEEEQGIVHRLVLDPEGAPERVLAVRELVREFIVCLFVWRSVMKMIFGGGRW